MTSPVRIGILGAARIVPRALLKPARKIDEVEVTAIAARDAERGRKFAQQHGIPRTIGGYQQLLDDPAIDAVYIALPNSFHCEWTIRALEAGKHVLCEKPLACNASEVGQMADAAARTGRILVEAIHPRYHPLTARVREILDRGTLGPLREIESFACVPILARHDIRWEYALGGGALMDMGVYAIDLVRSLAAAEPEVIKAEARVYTPNVDRWLRAKLRFPDGCVGRITCSLWSSDFLRIETSVRGEAGSLKIGGSLFHDLQLNVNGKKTRESLKDCQSTYYYQLKAFAAAITAGRPPITDVRNALGNMQVIDAAYLAAGLPIRGDRALLGKMAAPNAPNLASGL